VGKHLGTINLQHDGEKGVWNSEVSRERLVQKREFNDKIT